MTAIVQRERERMAWWWWLAPLAALALGGCVVGVTMTPRDCAQICGPGGVRRFDASGACECVPSPEVCGVDRLVVTPLPPGRRVEAGKGAPRG